MIDVKVMSMLVSLIGKSGIVCSIVGLRTYAHGCLCPDQISYLSNVHLSTPLVCHHTSPFQGPNNLSDPTRIQQTVLIYACGVLWYNRIYLYHPTKISVGRTVIHLFWIVKYWCPGSREPRDCSVQSFSSLAQRRVMNEQCWWTAVEYSHCKWRPGSGNSIQYIKTSVLNHISFVFSQMDHRGVGTLY